MFVANISNNLYGTWESFTFEICLVKGNHGVFNHQNLW